MASARNRDRKLRAGLVGVCAVVGLILLMANHGKPILRKLFLPGRVHAEWVDDLVTNSSLFTGWPEFTEEMSSTNFGNGIPELVRKANEQKRVFVQTFKSGAGQMGLRVVCNTVEGDPIQTWVLVDQGRLEWFRDVTRDRFSGSWLGISHRQISNLTVGYFKNSEFIADEPDASESVVIVLRLNVGGAAPLYFY